MSRSGARPDDGRLAAADDPAPESDRRRKNRLTGPSEPSGSPESPEPPEPDDRDRLRPTGPGPLAVFFGVGLVTGWVIRPLSMRTGGTEPQVGVTAIALLFFVAALVGWSAYHTWRVLRDGGRLAPHRAVNRLVLAKTCALVGAGVAGGYFGFALAHLGAVGEQVGNQAWHAAAAGVGGLALAVAALLLEQACRVRDDDS